MSEAKDAADRHTSVARVERVFVDSDGSRWCVYEQAFSAYDRRSGMSLIFANDAAMRRVRAFPAHWADLSDEELASLSWKA